MPLRACLLAFVMVSASVTAALGQPASSALEDAQRALSEALEQHDRAAFVGLFAPDAQCTLPSAAQGPEAIANLWLPFLIDPGTTLLMTVTTIAPGESADRGTTSGTFAIRGRTAAGTRTIPAGEFSVEWRVVDGHWKIDRLSRRAGGQRQEAANQGGVGPFRFGMTREDVSRVTACEPYTNVASTGGLECPSYTFDDRPMNVSFIFNGNGLRRVQLWYYEGESRPEAREAVGRVLEYLQKTTGGSFVCSQPGVPVTADGIMSALDRTAVSANRMTSVEIRAEGETLGERWFSRVARHQYGYLVLLLADPRPGQ